MVAGTPMMSPEEFLDRIGLAVGDPYEPEELNTRIAGYVDARRARGYYQARVEQAVSFSDDDRVANLTLTVTPGPRVSVVFTGDPLPGDTRAELVPIEREGSADEDLLEDSSNRIEEYLRAQGYRDARAPHTRQEKDGELLITFDGEARSAVPGRRRGDLRGSSLPVAGFRGRTSGPASASRSPTRIWTPT